MVTNLVYDIQVKKRKTPVICSGVFPFLEIYALILRIDASRRLG